MNPSILYAVIGVVAYIILAPFVGGLLAGFDRKFTAFMQGRKGPPILQPFYDVGKLMKKETTVVNKGQRFLVVCFLIFIVITGILFFAGLDLLMCFFALTTDAIFLVLAACSAHSTYSHLGGQRELFQMLCYEPVILLIAIGFYVATGYFDVTHILAGSVSPIVWLPLLFIAFVLVLPAKLGKSPFDISSSHHAHQEVVKGLTTELSGGNLAMVEIAHWYEDVFLLGVIFLFIANINQWWTIIVGIIACIVVYFIQTLIDNTCARVKWNEMLRFTWLVALALGVTNIILVYYFV